jgi:hypothetical protein
MNVRAAWILVLAVLSSATLPATVGEPTTLRHLAAGAALIVRGTVTDVRAVSDPTRGIETVATVSVDRVLKGSADATVAVRVPGGVVGRYRRVTIGAPVLRLHQHSVFFLRRGADNGWRPVGLSAGIVRVLTEPSTGRRLIYPAIVQGQTAVAGVPIVRGDALRKTLSVEEFESLVGLVAVAPVPPVGVMP